MIMAHALNSTPTGLPLAPSLRLLYLNISGKLAKWVTDGFHSWVRF